MMINRQARSYIAKNQNNQEFFIQVTALVERQLQEWSTDYRVYIMKLTNYELTITNKHSCYRVEISEEELELLRSIDSHALDRKIWNELQNQGLAIKKGAGDDVGTLL